MKSYIYMGVHPTYAVLQKNGKRVEVQPNEVVDSEVILGWSFMAFDENIIDSIDKKITLQEQYVLSAEWQKDLLVKELKAKHKEEMNALLVQEDAKIKTLTDRLDLFKSQKTQVAKNIDKAKLNIQHKIDALTQSVKKFDWLEKPKQKASN